MKKTTVLLLLMTVASAYAQNLKTSIDGSLLNQGAKGINAMKLRNTLHLMTDSLKVKPTKQTLGLGNVDNTSDINKPISSATQIELDKKADIYSMQTALDTKSGLTSNNLFTGTNTFYTPVFANSTTPNLYSKLTGAWSSNSNIATFSLNYETRFGGNTISRTPLSIDYNGWVGIGVASPTTALDVSGAIKATSSITALNLNSYSTTLLATNVGGNVGIGLGSPSSKLHVAGTGRITGALILDNTVSGLLRADASGNITSDATAYLSSSTASSTYAPITSPTFTGNVTLPSTTSIGNVSDTELSYVDGATSNIQNQLNTKVNGSSYYNGNYGFLVSKKIFGVPAPPNFLPNIFWSNQFVDANDMDLQFALGINTKEPSIAQGTTSQYFRGDKTFQEVSTLPISSATQSALDLKANITSPTFITDATTPRLKITGAGDVGKGSDLVMAGNSDDLTMHGTGKVILGTGGFQRLVVTNAGNVGVGTTAPVAKFEVSGLAGFRYNDGKQADGKYLRSNSTGVAAWDSVKVSEVFGLNTTYLPINNPTATGTLIAPTIANSLGANFATTSGNVGVGTASPTSKIHVIRTGVGIQDLLTLDNLNQSVGVLDGVRLNLRGFNIEASSTYGSSDNILNLGFSTSKQITLLQNGNVGIGTNSPAVKLEVNDTANTNAVIVKANGATTFLGIGNSSSLPTLQAYTAAFAGTTNLLINPSGGNVGIGTTAPSAKLTVAGTGGTSTISLTETGVRNYAIRSGGYGTNVFDIADLTAGASRFVINSTGNVGINTGADLGYKLDVNGSARVTGTFSLNSSIISNSAVISQFRNSSNILRWELDREANETGSNAGSNLTLYRYNDDGSYLGTTLGIVRANGHVGIGTAIPSEKLEISGGNVKIANNQKLHFGDGANANGFSIGADATNAVLLSQNNNSSLRFNAGFSSSANNVISFTRGAGTESMRIDGSGNVGIGTNAPATNLHVNRATTSAFPLIRLETTGAGGRPYMDFKAENVDYGYMGWGGTSNNNMFIQNYLNADLQFGTNSATRVTIRGGGNVLIGTTTDLGYKLDVSGTAQATQFKLSALNTAPASATATGTTGEIRVDANYIYICTATNTWKRSAITSW